MLQQLLVAMSTGEVTTQQDLAQHLNVPLPVVAQMVDQLVDQGYLREGDQCASGCDSCGLHAACGGLEARRVWTLTEKGWRAANNGRP